MRTCPACGEETSAAMSDACTKCGFSPSGVELEATFEVASDSPPEPQADTEAVQTDTPASPPPGDEKPPLINLPDQPSEQEKLEPAKLKRSEKGRWIGIAVGVAALIGFRAFGGEDDPTGPEPGEVESAITDRASEEGITMTVDCPDGTEDTAVGASFECGVTLPDGRVGTATVHNGEDSYRWKFSGAQKP
jgi:hypothetical protein